MRLSTFTQLLIALGLAALVGILLVPSTMRIAVEKYLYVSVQSAPVADVALVLSASVRRGAPSPILEERAHKAVELYRAKKVSKILVSGDSSTVVSSEVTPVRKYLLDMGIPAEDIFLDHAGFDTYSSMYRAREIFEADSIIIVTQYFHLPRSIYIARELGISAYGMTAHDTGVSFRNYIREIPASVKALIDLWMNRQPKYLGEKIPLSGDGSKTWGIQEEEAR